MTKEKKVRINFDAPESIKDKAREQSKKLFFGEENIRQYIRFLINNDPPR